MNTFQVFAEDVIAPNAVAYPQAETCKQLFNRHQYIPKVEITSDNFDEVVKDKVMFEAEMNTFNLEVLSFLSGMNASEITNGNSGKNILEASFGEHADFILYMCRDDLKNNDGATVTGSLMAYHYKENLEPLEE